MKIYHKILIGALACAALTGCEDELDRFPKDKLTPDTFFNTGAECELYTNDFYTMFPGGNSIYGEGEDIITLTSLSQEVLGTRTVPSTASTWEWNKLRDINFFLQHSSNCDDEAERSKYEGLARFFRAYFYFEKVKRYGDVPWLEEALDSDDDRLYMGRTPRAEVVRHIIDDIDNAIAGLDGTKDVYRVSRWTAMALKSRILLFEGTFRKYHDMDGWEELLKGCAEVSGDFISKSGYTIYNSGSTPYLSLFNNISANKTEFILARAYNDKIKLMHDANGYVTSMSMGRPGLLRDVVCMYLMTDGTPFTSRPGWEIMTFADECRNRDKRLAQTIRPPGYQRIGESAKSAPNLAACETGYQPIKYLQSSKYDAYNASIVDLPLFRAAEVYLNYAEAKAELGTLTQADIDLAIKPLRDRAGVANLNLAKANANPDPYLSDPVTGYTGVEGDNKGVILEIRRERTVELIMEGFRYWDIMRWRAGKRFERQFTGMYFPSPGEYDLDSDGKADVCLWSGARPTTTAPVVYELEKDIFLSDKTSGYILVHDDYPRHWNEERDYLYPVPTDDRIITQGAISQNPGWNDGLNF